jgi:hypothetical protein
VPDDFLSFMTKNVLPLQAAHPARTRLDGEPSGGNRNEFGRFRWGGREWVVNCDTHLEPLLLAYRAAQENKDPFVEEATPEGRSCLALTKELQAKRSSPHKHMYIYPS